MPPPARWEQYKPLSDVILGTKIIVFKVPLKEALCKGLSKDAWFTPNILMEQVQVKGHKLKMLIDLTFTKKYYNAVEFTNHLVKYVKIFTMGHEIPKENIVQSFFEAMDVFEKTSEKDSVVGVHCTHGVNRTGYMVCRYMIDRFGFEPEDAIREFEKARGYPIERQNYLDDLKARSHGTVSKSCNDEQKSKSRNGHHSKSCHSQPHNENAIYFRNDQRRQHRNSYSPYQLSNHGDRHGKGRYFSGGSAELHGSYSNVNSRQFSVHDQGHHNKWTRPRGTGNTATKARSQPYPRKYQQSHSWNDQNSRYSGYNDHNHCPASRNNRGGRSFTFN